MNKKLLKLLKRALKDEKDPARRAGLAFAHAAMKEEDGDRGAALTDYIRAARWAPAKRLHVDELMRAGSLAQSDFLGDRGFVVADGRKLAQKTVRLRQIQVGDRTMDNVLASVGPRFSQALLGQSLLRRLNWWKIDNVKNAIELEFTGSF